MTTRASQLSANIAATRPSAAEAARAAATVCRRRTKVSITKGKLLNRSIGPAMLVTALTGFATLAEAQTVSASWPHYTVTNLGALGGSQSNGYGGVTNNGWVSGDSFLRGDKTEHAFLWRVTSRGSPS